MSCQVYKILKDKGADFCFLQCTSAYPLNPEDVHLRVIEVSPNTVASLFTSSGVFKDTG